MKRLSVFLLLLHRLGLDVLNGKYIKQVSVGVGTHRHKVRRIF